MTPLIDGDILVYKAAFSARSEVDWGDGILSEYADQREARQIVDTEVAQIRRAFGMGPYQIALSAKGDRWREGVLSTYKSNRVTPKPIGFWDLYDYLMDVHGAVVEPTLEGDDLLGIWATSGEYEDPVIVSKDKDMRTVPGKVVSGVGKAVEVVTEDEADLRHLVLALAGDPIDGFHGCPKFGKKTANRLLALLPPDERWPAIVEVYAEKELDERYALCQARVARVLRHGEYDFKKREVKLWVP